MANKAPADDRIRLPVTEEFRRLLRTKIGGRPLKPLAERAGMSEMALRRILGEVADKRPSNSSDRLVELCTVLGIPLFEAMPLDESDKAVLRAITRVRQGGGDVRSFIEEIERQAEWKAPGPTLQPATTPRPTTPAIPSPVRPRGSSDLP